MTRKLILACACNWVLVACDSTDEVIGTTVEPSTHPLLISANGAGGHYDLYKARADGTDLINLTSNPATDWEGAWSPDGKRVAFSSNRNGNFDIFVMNDDGTQVRQLTNDPLDESQPQWSSDGQKILFTSLKDGGPTATVFHFTSDLFVINADGTNLAHLTSTPRSDELSPAWSPDGRKILYSRRDYNDAGFQIASAVYVMNADGTGSTPLQLAGTDFSTGGTSAAWSPDSKRVAMTPLYNKHPDFIAQTVVVVANADGTKVTTLTPLNSTLLINYPAWSPDGSKVLFTMVANAETWGRVGGGEEYDIGVVNTDGTGFTNLYPERPTTDPVDHVVSGPQAWRK